MRAAFLVLALVISLPLTATAQVRPAVPQVEKFDVSGLPQTPSSDKERDIFTFLRVHRKGDFADATRIHLLLAEFYREQGEKTRSEDCLRQAAEAWAASTAAERATAGAPGRPPFLLKNPFRGTFTYSDDLKITHTWDFFRDGSFAHSLADASNDGAGPTELGWYSLINGRLRLWQLSPGVDREVAFEFLGEYGSDGAMLDGVRMKPGS